MTLRILGNDLDRSEAQFAVDRLLKEYFARLPVIDAPGTDNEGRPRDLASDTATTARPIPSLHCNPQELMSAKARWTE
jgi:hypothetical protein